MKIRYQPPRSLREPPASIPSELEVQAIWFEQLHQSVLTTDDGRTVEIIQPGFWNHGGGPDFTQTAVRFAKEGRKDKEITVGNVEVHLRPADWNAHGHDSDPAYDNTILHVVWEARGKSFFPATSSFRRVPQIVLGSQLLASWPELQPLCASVLHYPLPASTPGRCSPVLDELPKERVTDILRAAGTFRLRQKARRWFWRRHLTSPEQALHEALAEALGFHANQIPMRLVAQRLPWTKLRSLDANSRLAHLFGLSGFLPGESTAKLRTEPKTWLRKLWEIWWKARGELDYALLPRSQWKLAGLRPLNRPERRLAALAQIVPKIPALRQAIEAVDADRFGKILLSVGDPFWEKHATITGTPLPSSCRLIGEERVHDILINIFWPMVSLDDPEAAQRGLSAMTMASNGAARIASQRMLISALSPKAMREALIQQGLLQIFRDYCQTDCSQCRNCTFPELVKSWER
ncbi:MAG: DUF2851 family protein [Methylacidiphilales bacterium]|nr:DUF2851 family protein [Candidatus Methylacidiphilales bacterium]